MNCEEVEELKKLNEETQPEESPCLPQPTDPDPEPDVDEFEGGCTVNNFLECFMVSSNTMYWCCMPCTKSEYDGLKPTCEMIPVYARALCWYACIGLFLYFLNLVRVYESYWDFMEEFDSVGVIIFICTIFLFLAVLQNLFVSYPTGNEKIDRNGIGNSYAIIACHMSSKEIGYTIRSLLAVLSPKQIFLADNGNLPEPGDNTKEVAIGMGIPPENYYYMPIASKVNALYTVARRVKRAGALEAKYVILIDDDTMIPDNFQINEELFDDDEYVSAISCGIKINRPESMVEQLVDWEYRIFCLKNYWRSKL